MMGRNNYGMSAAAPAAPTAPAPSMGANYGMGTPVRGLSLAMPSPVTSHLMGQQQQSAPIPSAFAQFMARNAAANQGAGRLQSGSIADIFARLKAGQFSPQDTGIGPGILDRKGITMSNSLQPLDFGGVEMRQR